MRAAAIIGGGSAGCRTVLWLSMLGFYPFIIEKNSCTGGIQVISPYPNHWIVGLMDLHGDDITKNMEKHIERSNVPVFFNDTVEAIKKQERGFIITINQHDIPSHFIVIATGVIPCPGNLYAANNTLIGSDRYVFEFDFRDKRVAGDYAFIHEQHPETDHVYVSNNLWNQIALTDIFLVLHGWHADISTVFEHDKPALLNEKHFIPVNDERETQIPGIYAAGEVTQALKGQ